MAAAERQAVIPPQGGKRTFRAREGEWVWKGFVESDCVPENRIVPLINGRFRHGRVVPRKGQQKLNETALHAADAAIRGIVDFQVGTRRSLYMAGPGCPLVSGSVGFFLGLFDHEQDPVFQAAVYYDFANQGLVFGRYAGSFHLGQDNNLRRLQLITPSWGSPTIALSGRGSDLPVKTFAGFTKISALTPDGFDGRQFGGLDNGASSKVYAYDGVTFIDDLTGINPPTGFMLWRDKLILGYGGAPNHIRVRATGTPPGTWATVNPAAGTIIFRDGKSYRDKAYIVGTGVEVWSYDGTTLQITHSLPVGSVTSGIEVFDGLLFVSYTNGGNARIARYDGSAWADVHKDLTAQDATITKIDTIAGYRDALVGGVIKSGASTIAYSVQYATSGTWKVLTPISLTNLERSLVF